MISHRFVLSAVLLPLLLTGCVPASQSPELCEPPKTEIIYQTSLAGQFLSCLNGSLKMSGEQRRLEKEQARKMFVENSSPKNRLWLSCLALAEDSPESLQYSLSLLQEQRKLSQDSDSQLDGLIDMVGRLLASKKEAARHHETLTRQKRELDSLRAKMEKLKKIEKLMTEREK